MKTFGVAIFCCGRVLKNNSAQYLLFFALTMLSLGLNAQVMLGAYVPKDGWSREPIQEWNQQVGQKAAFINVFSSFSHNWQWHLKHQANNLAAEGAVPMISWMPIDRARPEANILSEIIRGEWDEYLIAWIKGAQQWLSSQSAAFISTEPRLMIRFAHEFNGNWYSYSRNQPQEYVSAWQYVHVLFDEYRLNGRLLNDYIEWVWCPNNLNFDEVQDFTQYYPGDEFVDWAGIDGYNWGGNFTWSQWKSFSEVFSSAYKTLETNFPNKPIMIAEVGSANPDDTPDITKGQAGSNMDKNQNKNRWFKKMVKQLPEKFPLVKAVSIFNTNKELGWAMYGATHQGIKNSGLKGLKAAMRKQPNILVSDFIASK